MSCVFRISLQQWYCIIGPCKLDLKLTFLDQSGVSLSDSIVTRRDLDTFISYKTEEDGYWNLFTYECKTSLKGVRYIPFYHGGTCDTVFEDEMEQGNVGICLAKASLIISYPWVAINFQHGSSVKLQDPKGASINYMDKEGVHEKPICEQHLEIKFCHITKNLDFATSF